MNLNCEIDSPMHKAKMEYRAAIIEECAKVAERQRVGGGVCFEAWDGHDKSCELIARAIRALKDKP